MDSGDPTREGIPPGPEGPGFLPRTVVSGREDVEGPLARRRPGLVWASYLTARRPENAAAASAEGADAVEADEVLDLDGVQHGPA